MHVDVFLQQVPMIVGGGANRTQNRSKVVQCAGCLMQEMCEMLAAK